MSFFTWFHRPSRQQHKPRPRHTHTLHLEALEDRALPSAALPLAVGTTAAVGAVADQGPTITFTNGSGQSVYAGYSFQPLQARVTDNGQGVPGVPITFTAPADAASGFFSMFARSATVLTDANGWATAPIFTANGTLGTYTVTASSSSAAGLATFTLSNIAPPPALGPWGYPTLIEWQMQFNRQTFPFLNTPQGESDLANQFGTWFAFAYLQSPQQATQLFWKEIDLTQEFIWAKGSGFLLDRDGRGLNVSQQIVANPLFNTPIGYGAAVLESELILVSVL